MRGTTFVKVALFASLFLNSENAMNCANQPIQNQNMNIIYKILTPTEWQAFQKNKTYDGSQMDKQSGFIHAAFAEQKTVILDKFFKDKSQVVIVEIDTSKLMQGSLKVESNKEGGDKYPHIYGIIPFEAVKSSKVMLL